MVIKPYTESKAAVEEGITMDAYIIGHDKSYIIFINDLGRKNSITTISHELIHLNQYYTGKLKKSPEGMIWKDELIDVTAVSYPNKPWEIEAFRLQKDMIEHINARVY